MLSIAIYTNNNVDRNLVNSIKFLFNNYTDICLFTDSMNNISTYETAVLPSMFMEFHQGIIIFLDINHYLAYKSRLLSDNIYLYVDSYNNIDNITDRQLLKNFKQIITKNKDNMLTMVTI